uniref:CB1 cannabinoid receptor-interacting protein 1 n=1 Tax=Plectus sambesii TaxID=2011161 RepID=A0A914XFC6_9BILA
MWSAIVILTVVVLSPAAGQQVSINDNWLKSLTKNSLTMISRMSERCFFADGQIFEQGVSRPLTEEEKAQVEQFEQEMAEWQKQFNERLINWGEELSGWNPLSADDSAREFPSFPSVPVIPQSPCFCINCNVMMQTDQF